MRKQPIVLTRRGEKLMLAFFWICSFLLIAFADSLAKVLN